MDGVKLAGRRKPPVKTPNGLGVPPLGGRAERAVWGSRGSRRVNAGHPSPKAPEGRKRCHFHCHFIYAKWYKGLSKRRTARTTIRFRVLESVRHFRDSPLRAEGPASYQPRAQPYGTGILMESSPERAAPSAPQKCHTGSRSPLPKVASGFPTRRVDGYLPGGFSPRTC